MTERSECQPPATVLMVGLTGGIATGKSTVAGMLREIGMPIVDADQIVHGLLAVGGAAVQPIAAAFGPEVLSADQSVDRKQLAELVFRDESARERLESIVHPMVLRESRRKLRALAESSRHDIVIYDAALLIETSRHRDFQRVIVVSVDPQTQIARLMARDQLDADRAGARIRAQMPLARKVALADYVVDNSGPWHETRKRVAQIVELLHEDVAALRAGKPLATRRAQPQD
jgi:dephospho-CoA kinase